MLTILVFSALLSAATANPFADLIEPGLDSNTAFYEGAARTYVFSPPAGYRLVLEEAAAAGLSMAYIPGDQDFDTADLLVGITIYKVDSAATSFAGIIAEDTAAIRSHYGGRIEMWLVDSMCNAQGEIIPTVYVNDPAAFVPTVMVSYYNGGAEIIILELVISPRQPRFKAEAVFELILERFKSLRRGDPSKIEFGQG